MKKEEEFMSSITEDIRKKVIPPRQMPVCPVCCCCFDEKNIVSHDVMYDDRWFDFRVWKERRKRTEIIS